VRTRRVRSAGAVLADAGVVLGDLERLLALGGSSSSSSDIPANTTIEASGVRSTSSPRSKSDVLSAQGLGELCVGLHRYQGLLDTAAISSRGVPKMLRSSSENAKQVSGMCTWYPCLSLIVLLQRSNQYTSHHLPSISTLHLARP